MIVLFSGNGRSLFNPVWVSCSKCPMKSNTTLLTPFAGPTNLLSPASFWSRNMSRWLSLRWAVKLLPELWSNTLVGSMAELSPFKWKKADPERRWLTCRLKSWTSLMPSGKSFGIQRWEALWSWKKTAKMEKTRATRKLWKCEEIQLKMKQKFNEIYTNCSILIQWQNKGTSLILNIFIRTDHKKVFVSMKIKHRFQKEKWVGLFECWELFWSIQLLLKLFSLNFVCFWIYSKSRLMWSK